MNTMAGHLNPASVYPVDIIVHSEIEDRNRLTTAFRPILAIPHILFVGAPIAATVLWAGTPHTNLPWGTAGALGAVAAVVSLVAWFAIVFTGVYPQGLRDLATFYLAWRVRAVAYAMLLTDAYPPFGDGDFPAQLTITAPTGERDRLSVAFRIFLVIPHAIAVWFLGIAWIATTIVAWFAIILTGRYPRTLYDFAVDVLRWSVRVEAYVLLLRDEYPPFSMS